MQACSARYNTDSDADFGLAADAANPSLSLGADVERRITRCRLAVWLACGLLAFLFLRGAWPLAWQTAAFGAGVSLLWPLAGRGVGKGGKKEIRKPGNQEAGEEGTEAEYGRSSPPLLLSPSSPSDPLCHAIEIGLDLLTATALIAVTGGFGSPFASLVFVIVLEAYALLGQRAAIYTALASALLNLAHFRNGLSASSAILYGLATGTLFVAALLAGLSQGRARRHTDAQAGQNYAFDDDGGLLAPASVEEMQEQRDKAERASEQMREKYREVVQLHRDQRAQLARMRVCEQIWEASARRGVEAGGGTAAYGRILRLVMEMTQAGGGVLWLRTWDTNQLVPQLCEGRVGDGVRAEKIPQADTLAPSELRARCEAALQGVAPSPLRSSVSRLDAVRSRAGAVTLEKIEIEEDVAVVAGASVAATLAVAEWTPPPGAEIGRGSVGIVLIRAEGLGDEPGSILGALGICDPRGQARFLASELDRLQSLSRPLAQALCGIGERVGSAARSAELELQAVLRELRLSRPAREQIYGEVVALVMQYVPCDNCTLFLLDADKQHLQPRATQGRVVDLLDHILFERGVGVSGWVASRGRPLHLPDLSREPNLLDVETLPARVRSFIAMPLCVRGRILGVLNVSHAHTYAFSPDHLRLLSLLADQTALALEETSD